MSLITRASPAGNFRTSESSGYDRARVPRLGDILVDLDLCTNEQIHAGLAAQVLYGGRLGTNLVELGYLDLDGVARGLARRTRVPAALGGHFERRDLAIQARLPPELAAKLRAVPIGRLASDPDRIAVGVRDRLTEHGRGEIAFHLEIDPTQLVEAITPELRLYYHLELAYQIPRANRFLRVDSRTAIPVPDAPELREDSDVNALPYPPDAVTPQSSPMLVVPPDTDRPEPAALDYQTAPDVDDAVGRARRRFVPQLGEAPTALARIAVRQVTTDVHQRPGERDRPASRTLDELARAIRHAGSRDKVAAIVMSTLGDLPSAPLDAAVILIVRPPLAIGWKGFCHDGLAAIEALAVPLGEPGVIATSYRSTDPLSIDLEAVPPTRIDHEMWALLGGRPPNRAVVAPIVVGEQVVCLLYVQARGPLGAAVELVPVLAEAAGIAFSRLLRAAQR